MIRKTRRHTTLLELLIAMGLTMMIMTALAYFYRQLDTINREMEIQQNKLFKQLYLSTRLNEVLPRAARPSQKNASFFYTTTSSGSMQLEAVPSLIFTFDNNFKLDKRFSNEVLGRMYVDKYHRLCLGVWPAPGKWEDSNQPPMKCEVLAEEVTNIAFRFFVPPQRSRETPWKMAEVKTQPSKNFANQDSGEWKDEWQASWEQLPALIEMTIDYKNEGQLVFMYTLPNSNFFVVY